MKFRYILDRIDENNPEELAENSGQAKCVFYFTELIENF